MPTLKQDQSLTLGATDAGICVTPYYTYPLYSDNTAVGEQWFPNKPASREGGNRVVCYADIVVKHNDPSEPTILRGVVIFANENGGYSAQPKQSYDPFNLDKQTGQIKPRRVNDYEFGNSLRAAINKCINTGGDYPLTSDELGAVFTEWEAFCSRFKPQLLDYWFTQELQIENPYIESNEQQARLHRPFSSLRNNSGPHSRKRSKHRPKPRHKGRKRFRSPTPAPDNPVQTVGPHHNGPHWLRLPLAASRTKTQMEPATRLQNSAIE